MASVHNLIIIFRIRYVVGLHKGSGTIGIHVVHGHCGPVPLSRLSRLHDTVHSLVESGTDGFPHLTFLEPVMHPLVQSVERLTGNHLGHLVLERVSLPIQLQGRLQMRPVPPQLLLQALHRMLRKSRRS